MNIEQQVEQGVTSAFDKFKNLFVPKAAEDLEKTRKDLTAANDQIATLNKRVADLEIQLGAAQKETEQRDARIKELEGKIDTTEKSVNARANQKALVLEQQRGVTVPAQEEAANASGGTENGNGKTKLEEYRAISNPAERAAFWAKHKDAIYSGQ